MSLWRYGLAVWIAFTLIARSSLGLYNSGVFLDHIEASVTALLAAFVSTAFAYRVPIGRRGEWRAYVGPTIAGLIFIAIVAWGASRN